MEITDFECPICGSSHLYQRRTETVVQRFYPTNTDFDFGTEEVVDNDSTPLECGNDHPLSLKNGQGCYSSEDYVKWVKEQN